jgi:hypothetical protein
VVLGEEHVGLLREQSDRLVEVARPAVRVAHHGAPQREDVVQVVGRVSAMHTARRSGKRKFISAGASVSGVTWKTIRIPSTISSWPVWAMSTVGAISVTVPSEVVWPRPPPTCPPGPFGSSAPYM